MCPRCSEVAVANLTKRTPEKDRTILNALREKPSFATAARKARISRTALYDWRHADAAFDAACIAARNEGLDALEDALITRGMRDDTTAAIFMLKSLRRETYGEKQIGTADEPLHVTITRVTRAVE